MPKILSSATKVTLLILIVTLCVGTLLKIIEVKTFDFAIASVISFYFGKKSVPDASYNQPSSSVTESTTTTKPVEKMEV